MDRTVFVALLAAVALALAGPSSATSHGGRRTLDTVAAIDLFGDSIGSADHGGHEQDVASPEGATPEETEDMDFQTDE